MGKRGTVNLLHTGRGSLSLPPLMRTKTLYLATLMSEVLKPYNKQTQEVTAGTSTSPRRMARASVWVDLIRMFTGVTLLG